MHFSPEVVLRRRRPSVCPVRKVRSTAPRNHYPGTVLVLAKLLQGSTTNKNSSQLAALGLDTVLPPFGCVTRANETSARLVRPAPAGLRYRGHHTPHITTHILTNTTTGDTSPPRGPGVWPQTPSSICQSVCAVCFCVCVCVSVLLEVTECGCCCC